MGHSKSQIYNLCSKDTFYIISLFAFSHRLQIRVIYTIFVRPEIKRLKKFKSPDFKKTTKATPDPGNQTRSEKETLIFFFLSLSNRLF